MIRLLIADDHQVLKDGIKAMLRDSGEIEVAGDASNGLEVLDVAGKTPVDVVLLDISMPLMDGVETCKKLKQLHPFIKVLALTMYEESTLISRMVRNGATGYILKNTGKEELIEAIKAVYRGDTYFSDRVKDTLITTIVADKGKQGVLTPHLTRREQDIIKLIVNEHTTAEIARMLFISEKTVETHRHNLLQKLNARNTAGLVRIALERGLFD